MHSKKKKNPKRLNSSAAWRQPGPSLRLRDSTPSTLWGKGESGERGLGPAPFIRREGTNRGRGYGVHLAEGKNVLTNKILFKLNWSRLNIEVVNVETNLKGL